MKKYMIRLTSAAMFVGAALFTVSVSSQGHIFPVAVANALPRAYVPIITYCTEDEAVVTVCGAGNSTCTQTFCPPPPDN
jgi:hypothetical protein